MAYIDPHVHPEEGREFATRYYRWSLEQMGNEVRHGLPALRAFCSPKRVPHWPPSKEDLVKSQGQEESTKKCVPVLQSCKRKKAHRWLDYS